MEFHMVKQDICKMAAGHGWAHIKTQEWCINFDRIFEEDRQVVNVFWNKKVALGLVNPYFTVQTALNHPRKGKGQLNRKDVSMRLLQKIFENPRVHTHGKIPAYFKK